MGTTYHSQVEVRVPAGEFNIEYWMIVSRWEHQKDYGFARAFYSISDEGWPSDCKEILGETEEEFDSGYYDGKHHVSGELFVLLKAVDEIAWFVWAHALQEHVKYLISEGFEVRIIFWEL